MIKRMIDLFRYLNRKRLVVRKSKSFLYKDVKNRYKKIRPQKIKSILILHFQGGWGDFFYFAGLIKRIVECGVSCQIGTTKDLIERFKKLDYVNDVIDVSDSSFLLERTPDCVLDLDWIIRSNHNIDFIKKSNAWKVTCSDVLSNLKLFDDYIDLSKIDHMSKRYQKVLSYIVGYDAGVVLPIVPIDSNDEYFASNFISHKRFKEGEFIYFNAIGSERDREFSQDQIVAIVKYLLARGFCVIYYSPKLKINEDIEYKNSIAAAPKVDFFKISAIASKAKAIITPDTSLVHLASAFNIPTMAVYCKNDYDYYGYALLSEVWAPLSNKSIVVDLSSKSDIFKRKVDISNLSCDFEKITSKFITNL